MRPASLALVCIVGLMLAGCATGPATAPTLADQLVTRGLARADAEELIAQYGEEAIGQAWQECQP